jgi:hypothetical protein
VEESPSLKSLSLLPINEEYMTSLLIPTTTGSVDANAADNALKLILNHEIYQSVHCWLHTSGLRHNCSRCKFDIWLNLGGIGHHSRQCL